MNVTGTDTIVLSRHDASIRATPRFLSQLFLLLFCILLFLYRDSFAVKPSSDDFIALHQVSRGNQEGASTFFVASDVGDYRPLQNLTFWFFGSVVSREHIVLSFRVLHFVSFGFYALVACLWIRTLNLCRVGAIAAACVVFFHPIVAGPLAGVDNYSRFVVSAWVWLAAWIAYRFAQKPVLAVPLVSICFAIGLGYMEYAIALIPLAVVATIWQWGQRRFYAVLLMLGCLACISAVYFSIRVSGLVATSPGVGHLSLAPKVWIKNGGMIVASVLFFGNTVPIMLERSLPLLAWLGSNVAAVALAISYGLWNRRWHSIALPERRTLPVAELTPISSAIFLGVAFGVTFFPMVLMDHISEIYLTPITFALALLIGVSAQGWTVASRPLRYVAIVFTICQLLLACNAIRNKIAGVIDAGERTEAMMQQLEKHIPDDGKSKTVVMMFSKQDVAESKGYSIFAVPDDQLIQTGYATEAIRWFRPNQDIMLADRVVTNPYDIDLRSYDLALLWEHSTKRFIPIIPIAAVDQRDRRGGH